MATAYRWQACLSLTRRAIQKDACCLASRRTIRLSSRASFSTSHLSRQTSPSSSSSSPAPAEEETDVSAQIRRIMRASAQPVAVITTNLLPQIETETIEAGGSTSERIKFRRGLSHAATLSSFTTVSLDPPLIAFSLRTPSRMADALSGAQAQDAKQGDFTSARFVINVLSDAQAFAAQSFAKPGLPPYCRYEDWSLDIEAATAESTDSLMMDAEHPLDLVPHHDALFAHSRAEDDDDETAVPVLSESIGAFACSLVKRINLETLVKATDDDTVQTNPSTQGSDLFLARVHGLEEVYPVDEERPEQPRRPLVYHEQGFTTISSERIDPTADSEDAANQSA